ncbi:MAG: hypothetical protein SAK29_35705 [Scytonema sp. PMC 1069.18]|nr:hypothetical protein [Scytonema sp. PMC 1069.18]MEC4881891.1 hypothetical protein [Scytonema sp. PMC 1070.18]
MNWKTPLGYYEKAIADLKRTQEQLQTELATLREVKASYATLNAELQATKQELQSTRDELQETKKQLANIVTEAKEKVVQKSDFEAIKQEIQTTKAEMTETQQCLGTALKTAQDKAQSAILTIESVKTGIENGSIVARKAIMLQGKDEQHWMKFFKLDSVNHHCFQIWRNDNTWHDTICIKAALCLQARNDKHWLKFQYLKDEKYDIFQVWKYDDTWSKFKRY